MEATDFKIDDILNCTVGGVSKEVLSSVISEIIDEKNVVATVEVSNK